MYYNDSVVSVFWECPYTHIHTHTHAHTHTHTQSMPSAALVAKRALNRAKRAFNGAKTKAVDETGSLAFLPDMVSDFRMIVNWRDIPNSIITIIVGYILRNVAVNCRVCGLDFCTWTPVVLLTTSMNNRIFLGFPYGKHLHARGVFGEDGAPPVELVSNDKITNERTLLDGNMDVGTVLRLQGYRWDQVLLDDQASRPTLEISRRFRHLKQGVQERGDE